MVDAPVYHSRPKTGWLRDYTRNGRRLRRYPFQGLSHLSLGSTQEGLTSGFGMGPGGIPPLWPSNHPLHWDSRRGAAGQEWAITDRPQANASLFEGLSRHIDDLDG